VVEKVIILYDSDPMIASAFVLVAEDDSTLEPFDGESPFFPCVLSLWLGGRLHILDQAMYRVRPIFWDVSVSGTESEVDVADESVSVSGGMTRTRVMILGIGSGNRIRKKMEKVIDEQEILSDSCSCFYSYFCFGTVIDH
jgi:hypothetical protein